MLDRITEPAAELPNRVAMRYARIAGLLYLPQFLLGPFALLYVRGTLVVPGDAAATVERIAAHGTLFRAGSLAELILPLLDVVCALLFYVLLRPVNQPIALLAAFFRLMMAAMAFVGASTNFAALRVLGDPDQALLLLDLSQTLLSVGLVAFAIHLLLLGYLIRTSNVLPGIVGILLMVASAGYVANSLRVLLVLDWPSAAQSVLLLPAFVAELSLCLWLLVKGVRPVAAAERVAAG